VFTTDAACRLQRVWPLQRYGNSGSSEARAHNVIIYSRS